MNNLQGKKHSSKNTHKHGIPTCTYASQGESSSSALEEDGLDRNSILVGLSKGCCHVRVPAIISPNLVSQPRILLKNILRTLACNVKSPSSPCFSAFSECTQALEYVTLKTRHVDIVCKKLLTQHNPHNQHYLLAP